MEIPIIFIVFLIFVFLFRYKMNQQEKATHRSNELFWEREKKSLFIRKKTLDDTIYLKADISKFPKYSLEQFIEWQAKKLYKVQEDCLYYASQPMVNLSNMLNSEIRLKYGTANLTLIESYENNYISYTKQLYQLGKGFYDINRDDDAITVLEEGIRMGSDISHNYILLGKLYCKTNQTVKFQDLYNKTTYIESLTKHKIIDELNKLINSYHLK